VINIEEKNTGPQCVKQIMLSAMRETMTEDKALFCVLNRRSVLSVCTLSLNFFNHVSHTTHNFRWRKKLQILSTVIMIERPTKCIFKVNHIFRISILLLHVSALQERHLQGAQSDPDEIVRMLRHLPLSTFTYSAFMT
jgi:hypothetical protein